MISIVFLPLFTGDLEPRSMTHSEMTHLLPSPDAVPCSSCPGEMIESDIAKHLGSQLGDGRGRRASVSELWHCDRCGYTLHLERDARGVRRIRNGYPAPTVPSLKVV